MLVLTRKSQEVVQLHLPNGFGTIEITVIDVRGGRVRLGIDAPWNVDVERKENADTLPAELRETLREGRRQRLQNANWETANTKIPEQIPEDCCQAGTRQ